MSSIRAIFETTPSFEFAQVKFNKRFSSFGEYGKGFGKALAYTPVSVAVAVYALALDVLKVAEASLKLIGSIREGSVKSDGKELGKRIVDVLVDLVYVPAAIINVVLPILGFVEALRFNPSVCSLSKESQTEDLGAKAEIYGKNAAKLEKKATDAKAKVDALPTEATDDDKKAAAITYREAQLKAAEATLKAYTAYDSVL